ncbi:glycosyl transferase [Lentzea sp. NBRC 105346]|uniref:glycosyltransferase family 2 protein n=1 Tax=Lentzea sp. NBRC 105346 TaxID=3032205 RepID=UPI0024A05D06|nr:glycosyltransferase [Lentzea sp. NBRC 105346]GLZ28567.1 glycosyl transferase [Lentzea sp. NBRC 105346]
MSRTTLVIATRDRRDDLTQTLAQLRANTPDVPIVVVDNGSSDDTAEVARSSATVIELGRNLGSSARNAGVEAAGTPYVAFSDDDSWWAPGALRQAEALFDAHPRLGLIAGRTLVGPSNTPDPMNTSLATSPLGRAPGLPGPSVFGFLCCAAIVRRSAFLQVGGISPVLFFIGEEKLLAWDLAAAGWASCYVDSVVAHHHPSPRRDGTRTRRMLELRNDLLSTWLRRPARCGVAGFGALAALAVRDRAAGWALAGALRRLPMALRSRRPLPPAVQAQVDLMERS